MVIKARNVIKKDQEEGDSHPNGTLGVSLGTIEHESLNLPRLHLVLYENTPNIIDGEAHPTLTVEFKLDIGEDTYYVTSPRIDEYLSDLQKKLKDLLKIEEI